MNNTSPTWNCESSNVAMVARLVVQCITVDLIIVQDREVENILKKGPNIVLHLKWKRRRQVTKCWKWGRVEKSDKKSRLFFKRMHECCWYSNITFWSRPSHISRPVLISWRSLPCIGYPNNNKTYTFVSSRPLGMCSTTNLSLLLTSFLTTINFCNEIY